MDVGLHRASGLPVRERLGNVLVIESRVSPVEGSQIVIVWEGERARRGRSGILELLSSEIARASSPIRRSDAIGDRIGA